MSLEELDQVFSVPTRKHATYQLRQVPWFIQKYLFRRDVGGHVHFNRCSPDGLIQTNLQVPQEQLYHWEGKTDIDQGVRKLQSRGDDRA